MANSHRPLKVEQLGPLFCVCIFLLLQACSNGNAEAPRKVATPITAATISVEKSASYEIKRIFTGSVEAARSSRLGFELSGLITAVEVDEGARVEAGQMLARLDTARLKAQRNEVAARLDQATAALNLAKATENRVREAVAVEAVSQQRFDEAKSGLAGQQAQVAALKAQQERLDVEIEKSVLYAPYTAVVIGRMVDEGQVINPGQPVLEIQEAGRLEVRIGLPALVAANQNALNNARLMINGKNHPAVLKTLIDRRDQQTRTIPAIFSLDQPGSGIRPGDLARLESRLVVEQAGFWLPQTAITESVRGLWSCYLLEPAGDDATANPQYRIRRRELEMIHEQGERVFVRGMLREGDIVVSEGTHRLAPGQLVRPASSPASTGQS